MDISLALGGGGAKGNAHIGVIRRLELEGYKIRAVAGMSFGAIVGLMYAAGFTPNEMQENFAQIDQANLFRRDAQDGPSILGLAMVRVWLDETFGDRTFESLNIPAAVTAVDAVSGNEVVISEGAIRDAILGAIALPGIFPAHEVNGWELIDGGVLNPVPVSVARMLAPDLPVVAVVLNDPLDKPLPAYMIPMPRLMPKAIAERIQRMNFAHTYDMFMRAVDLNARAMAHYRLQVDAPDVIIRPHVQHIDLLSPVDVDEIAKLGEEATERALPELARATSWMQRVGRSWFKVKA